MTRQICETCHKPILSGQPRYTIRDSDDGKTGRHYECHEEQLAELAAMSAKLPELTSKLQRSLADLGALIKKGKQDRDR